MSDSQQPDPPPGSVTEVQHSPPLYLGAESCAPVRDFAGTDRYRLLEEIARGGMGVVYRARDLVLDRDVGLKTLLKVPADGSGVVARFRDEARITGQLQHPNVPPVHDLGTLPDGRPYLAMKLINGHTLAALLADRADVGADCGRYLAVFEQIAQGVAYAHAHRVIHRDLKPQNVMVGAFGEVQIVDWGLAKVLASSPASGSPTSAVETGPLTDIRPGREDSDATRAGSIFGTPAYMPREQAIGAVDQIDARSDVFSLGGVLCAILTGAPPYIGDDAESTRQLAAVAKLDDALARLDACGAEPALIALCKQCLSPERDDRPRDAGEVATAVAELRADAERRARQAELDRVRAEGERAKAELQTAEQRKRRKVQLALLGAVLLLVTGGGAFAWWQNQQATERRFKAAQTRDAVRAGLALATDLRKQSKFKAAGDALAQVAELAKGGALELLAEVEQARRDLAFVVALDEIRYRKWAWVAEADSKRAAEIGGHFDTRIAPLAYRAAFAEHGLDPTDLSPAEVAERIGGSAIKAELVAAVDDWALYEPDERVRDRLLEAARRADPGPWADRLRDPAVWGNKAAVEKLADEADPGATSAALGAVAALLQRHGLDPTLILSAAHTRHPTNFELAFVLGNWRLKNSADGREIGPLEAALALRPDNAEVWNNLGIALRKRGDLDAAVVAYRQAIPLARNPWGAYSNLGVALMDGGNLPGAITALREAVRFDPRCAIARVNLGVALERDGDLVASAAAYREAIALDPTLGLAHYNLASVHHDAGELDKAVDGYRRAIAAFKATTPPDANLFRACSNLGLALHGRGDFDAAITAHREAIAHNPKAPEAWVHLGNALGAKGDRVARVAAYRESVRLAPSYANGHSSLGQALKDSGDLEGAVAASKEAVRLDPGHAVYRTNLAQMYTFQKKYPEAIVNARAAIAADPKYANAHAILGYALAWSNDAVGARSAFTEAARLDESWRNRAALFLVYPVAPPPREVTRP